MIIYISESTRPGTNWMAQAEGHRTVHFGQRGASDFTIHRDEALRQAYIVWHGSNENLGQDRGPDAGLAVPSSPVGEAQPPCRRSRGIDHVPGRALPDYLGSPARRRLCFRFPRKKPDDHRDTAHTLPSDHHRVLLLRTRLRVAAQGLEALRDSKSTPVRSRSPHAATGLQLEPELAVPEHWEARAPTQVQLPHRHHTGAERAD